LRDLMKGLLDQLARPMSGMPMISANITRAHGLTKLSCMVWEDSMPSLLVLGEESQRTHVVRYYRIGLNEPRAIMVQSSTPSCSHQL
jgi:hypothetical protein